MKKLVLGQLFVRKRQRSAKSFIYWFSEGVFFVGDTPIYSYEKVGIMRIIRTKKSSASLVPISILY